MSSIKYLITDIDGSLTDGKIYMGNDGESVKAFSIKDGYAVNFILKPEGIETIVITGRTSRILDNRCREIGIDKLYQGKVQKFPSLLEAVGENLPCCAYFGDDVLDLACMLPIKDAGGVIGCPADAVKEVKAISDYICLNKAGEGAFREFSEWLIKGKKNKNEIEERVNLAIDYIRRLNLDELVAGQKYEVNEDFYYSLQEYETKPWEECILESHRKYIDIQWIAEGTEELQTCDVSCLALKNEYNEEKDIMFWKPQLNMTRVVLRDNTYIVLYPKDAHMGCIAVGKPEKVKKIVGKVKAY